MVTMIVEITRMKLVVLRAVQSARVQNSSARKHSSVYIIAGFVMVKMIAMMAQMRKDAVSILQFGHCDGADVKWPVFLSYFSHIISENGMVICCCCCFNCCFELPLFLCAFDFSTSSSRLVVPLIFWVISLTSTYFLSRCILLRFKAFFLYQWTMHIK